MDNIALQIFTILTTPPGNLIYHLVVAFCVASAFQGALVFWRTPQRQFARRMTLGLALILIAQILSFFSSGLSWQGFITPDTFLPVVDRAVVVFCLIWVIWLWAFPERITWVDTLAGAFSVLVLIALALSLSTWLKIKPGTTFNNSSLDTIWELSALAFVLTGSLILILKRPSNWGTGLGMLVLIAAGLIFHLVFISPPANFSGAVRLAQLAAFPMLLTLPQRLVNAPAAWPVSRTIPAKAAAGDKRPFVVERRRYSADPKTVHAFLKLAGENDPSRVCQALARSVGQALLADMSLFISLPDPEGKVTLQGGYDLVQDAYLESNTLQKDDLPLVVGSLQHGRPQRLPASHTATPDMKTLASVFNLSSPGNLLAVPYNGPDQQPAGGILLLSSFTNRVWSDEDAAYLTSIAAEVAQILQRNREAPGSLKPLLDTANQQIADLQAQLDTSRQQLLAGATFQAENGEVLQGAQKEFHEALELLQVENEALRRQIDQIQGSDQLKENEHLESELQKVLSQTAHMQNALADANIKILEMERAATPGAEISRNQADAIISIIQELRHPVAAMINQSELLIKEAGQPATPAQGKAMGRIKAASERMASLLDELVDAISIHKREMDMLPGMTDLAGVIDEAITFTAPQILEKNMSLDVALPESLPPLYTDRDGIQQTLIYLLQNAALASPAGGTIRIKAMSQDTGGDQPYAVLQITDEGGGIPEDEIAHLFSNFFSHNRQIQGAGSPQDLVMAKTLVESNGGRIWVETDPGKSSTFCVLLPLAEGAEDHSDQERRPD